MGAYAFKANQSKPRHLLSAPAVTGRPAVLAAPLPPEFVAAVKALPDGEELFALFQLPGSPAYVENNTCWNFDAAGSPSAIFQPRTEAHLAEFLKLWAAKPLTKPHSLSIAGGRHSHYGQKDHAIIIDMQKFDSMNISADKSSGKFGAGLRLRAFDAFCKSHGVAVTAGTNPDTGIAGLTLGGGFGYLGRRHGLTADNLLSVRVVLASGETVTATQDNEHAGLLWACRGGGGNFGVIVEFEYRLYPRGDVLSGATIFFTRMFNDIPSLLAQWHEAGKTASNDVNLTAVLPCSGPALVLPVAYLGEDLEGEGIKQLAPFRALGRPWIDTVKRKPYSGGPKIGADLQSSAEPSQLPGLWYESAVLLADLPREAIDLLVNYTSTLAPNKESSLALALLGGAMSNPSAAGIGGGGGGGGGGVDSAAIGWRNARYFLLIFGKWSNQSSNEAYTAERTKVVRWVKAILRDLAPFSIASYNTVGDEALDEDKTRALREAKAAVAAAGASAVAAAADGSGPRVTSPIDQPDPFITVATPAAAASSSSNGAGGSGVSSSSSDPDDVTVNIKSMSSWSDVQYARLQDIKARYDPTNIFTNCNNILPKKQ